MRKPLPSWPAMRSSPTSNYRSISTKSSPNTVMKNALAMVSCVAVSSSWRMVIASMPTMIAWMRPTMTTRQPMKPFSPAVVSISRPSSGMVGPWAARTVKSLWPLPQIGPTSAVGWFWTSLSVPWRRFLLMSWKRLRQNCLPGWSLVKIPLLTRASLTMPQTWRWPPTSTSQVPRW